MMTMMEQQQQRQPQLEQTSSSHRHLSLLLRFVLVSTLAQCGQGFVGVVTTNQHYRRRCHSQTALSLSTTTTTTTTNPAKQDLLLTCRRIKEDNGIFVVEKTAQDELLAAVDDLLSLQGEDSDDDNGRPTPLDFFDKMVGDWELLCTTTTKRSGSSSSSSNTSPSSLSPLPLLDKSKLPSFLQGGGGPLGDLRRRFQSNVNRDIQVIQRIRKTDDNDNDSTFNRVDNVIEFTPPKALGMLLGNDSPDALQNINLNPLQVSQAKVTLIHDARVTANNLQVELNLKSIVWNIAGTSQFLNPDGADVLGLNVPPLADFLQQRQASFETLYLDDTLRISKGSTIPGWEQVRVFVRRGDAYTGPVATDIETLESTGRLDETTNVQDSGMDVDEVVDPEFASDNDDNKDDNQKDTNNDEHFGQDDVSPSDY